MVHIDDIRVKSTVDRIPVIFEESIPAGDLQILQTAHVQLIILSMVRTIVVKRIL